jgi:HEAT repeat protein
VDDWMSDLRDNDAAVRLRAAEALRALGPEASAAEGRLIELMRDSDANVQNAARTALQAVRKGR